MCASPAAGTSVKKYVGTCSPLLCKGKPVSKCTSLKSLEINMNIRFTFFLQNDVLRLVSGCALLWRRTEERPHQRPLPLRLLTPSCLSRAVAWQCWGRKRLSLCRRRRKLEWCCLLASLNLSLNVIAAPVQHTVNHVEIEMFMLVYELYKKLFHFSVT